jgi:hypothetical protein
MNEKDSLYFMDLQKQVLSLIIKVSVLEKLLIKEPQSIINVEEYNKELTKAVAIAAEQVKEWASKENTTSSDNTKEDELTQDQQEQKLD